MSAPKNIIAIDPGAKGAWCWHPEYQYMLVENLPTLMDMCHQLKDLNINKWRIVIEKNNAFVPGTSGGIAVKLARHIGELHGLILGLGFPIEEVTPYKWQKWLLGTVPKDQAKRKAAIHDRVQRMFPETKISKRNADAVGIMAWARDHEGPQ